MSHSSVGYFYFRYTYNASYTTSQDKTPKMDPNAAYHSAVYTPAAQSHSGQTEWYKTVCMPDVEWDIKTQYYGDADHNKLGRKYEPYNKQNVETQEFMWCQKLPMHSDGPLKGQPFGLQIPLTAEYKAEKERTKAARYKRNLYLVHMRKATNTRTALNERDERSGPTMFILISFRRWRVIKEMQTNHFLGHQFQFCDCIFHGRKSVLVLSV